MSVTAKDLLAEPDQIIEEYISGGILGHRQIMLLAAPAASFKSIIGLNLAHALANGSKLFGYFDVKTPTRVSLFDKEVGRVYVKKRLKAFYAETAVPDMFHISTPEDDETDFYLDHAGSLDVFRREIEKTRPNVVILDCLNPLLMGEETGETYAALADNVDRLQRDFKELKLSFIVLHHMREVAFGQDPLSMYAIRGHGKLVDWAGTRVMLHRQPNFKKIGNAIARLNSRWVCRHAPEIPKMELIVRENFHLETPKSGLINL